MPSRTGSHWTRKSWAVITGHYPDGPVTQVAVLDNARSHPILAGVELFQSVGSLYKNTGLAADSEVLLTGSIPGHTEPIAWTRIHSGGRVFYTSLGHPQDFKNASFLRLLTNALFWAAKQTPPQGPRRAGDSLRRRIPHDHFDFPFRIQPSVYETANPLPGV